MDWLKNLLSTNPIGAMLIPTIISGGTFLIHLLTALSDGQIDATEYSQLMASANGVETLALIIIMFALSKRKKEEDKFETPPPKVLKRKK